MKYIRGTLVVLTCLLASFGARAEVLWNKPNVAPYTGTAAFALDLMADMLPQEVLERLLGMLQTYNGCTRTMLVPGLQLTGMMSGRDRLIPNVRVGDWPGTTKHPTGAWSCRTELNGVEYYVLVPDVCGNIALVVVRNGICVPNPQDCDSDCATYAKKYIS